MATYKVIQDIEAEDKFLGPLTLKQFVFGAGGMFFGYLSLFAVNRGYSWLLTIFIPPMLLGIFMAVPWSKDQPTEVWVLAKLRFYFKPRRRIWDQTGLEELVTVTAPKKEEKPLVDNLSKTEVKSRLKILAETIDSRGWAIKDAQLQTLTQPNYNQDRLVSSETLPKEVPIIDLATIPDVYDKTAPAGDNIDRMMQQSAEQHKAHSLEVMNKVRQGEDVDQPPTAQFTPPPTSLPPSQVAQISAADEQAMLSDLRSHKSQSNIATSRLHKINPLGATPSDDPMASFMQPYDDTTGTQQQVDQDQNDGAKDQITTVPEPSSPAILELANNNDLNVATIARQAKKEFEDNGDEVIISLH